MSQAEIARYIGVTKEMVSRWESGEYNFTINTLNEICDKLDLVFEPVVKNKFFYSSQVRLVNLGVHGSKDKIAWDKSKEFEGIA